MTDTRPDATTDARTGGPPDAPPDADNPWPVRLVSKKVGDWIARLGRVWVEGQVTQLRVRPGARLQYLTLRDVEVDVSLRVAVPVSVLADAGPAVADGARVVMQVQPAWWPGRGELTFRASVIRAVGLGELLARLEHLRRVLAAEGLFAAERKRPLPFLPLRVGLVCGRASAAMTDVLENARRRWPAVEFEVREVVVQGASAVPSVIGALRELDAHPQVDVIVLARGGGSFEDLLPFSDEGLVRAVASCGTPVVSAIGHEEDHPIVDLVADHRASTPTDAARRIVPDWAEESALVTRLRQRGTSRVTAVLDRESHRLDGLRAHPGLRDPGILLDRRAAEVQAMRRTARRETEHQLSHHRAAIDGLAQRLRALSPQGTLERGYAVVRTVDGHVVRRAGDVPSGTRVGIRVADGSFAATAD